MTARRPFAALPALVLAGCVAAPVAPVAPAPLAPPVTLAAPAPERAMPKAPEPERMIESPPVEPVDVPAAQPVRDPPPVPLPASQSEQVAVIPPTLSPAPVTPPPQVIVAEPTAEEREFIALLTDLTRYNAMSGEDVRRETQTMAHAVTRGRSDANRVRLAVLYTLTRQSAQDDQRALQLFETVAKSAPASAAVKQLAAVLSVQVAERVRAVRDEQARSEAAIQKLEALRAMERSLLRDRVRSGGGGGGAGSGGGN